MPTLEFLPDDWGKKNRGLLWKKLTESDTNQWYGPARPAAWLDWFYPSEGPGSSGFERWVESPSPVAHPRWYDPTVAEKAGEVAATDSTGSKQTALNIRKGVLYITPEPYKDDVSAFLYYGSIGLMDPKNPADAAGYSKMFGWSYSTSLGVALIGGFFFWGALGWFFDPHDKREEVGGWRSEWYDKWMNPDNYSFPQGW